MALSSPSDAERDCSRAASSARDRLRRDKCERILEAATRVFARQGYHGCRISDIAREAGVAYGLVYHYFKNKEEILNSIFERRWGGLLRALEPIAAEPKSAHDRLLAVATLILNTYRLRPEWVRVLVVEIQRSPRFAEPGALRAVGQLFGIVEEIIRSGQKSGELRSDMNTRIASTVFIGALEIAVTSLVLDLAEVDPAGDEARKGYPQIARGVVDVFLNGMSRGVQNR